MEPFATVDPSTAQPTQVAFGSVAPTPPLTQDVAESRARKAEFGIGPVVNQSFDQIYQKLMNGGENDLRREAANGLDYANMQSKIKSISDIAAARGHDLTLDEVNAVLNPANPSNQPNNPDSVIEKGYAHAYMGTLPSAALKMEDTPLAGADPGAVNAYIDVGNDLLSKREMALKMAHDLQPAVADDAYFNIPTPIGDIPVGSKSAPVRSTLNIATLGAYGALADALSLVGNTDQTSRFGFPGEQLDKEARELLDLPMDQFTPKMQQIVGDLAKIRPDLGQKFASAVAGMSTSDKLIDDVMPAANASGFLFAGSVARAGLRSLADRTVRGFGTRPTAPEPNAPQGPAELSAPNTIDAVKNPDGSYSVPNTEVRQAVKDTIQSANTDEVTKASMAAGVGDINESGVQKAVASTMAPDPAKDAIQVLPRYFRADISNQRTNPGDLSVEKHVRLIDAGESFMSDVIDTAANTAKVLRTPAIIEDAFRGIEPIVAQHYPGRANTIGNVDTVWDDTTNTYHHSITILDYDGNQFVSKQAALNHAQMNGYGQPAVVQVGTEGRYYIPEAAIKRPWESDTRLGSVEVRDGVPKVLTDDGAEVQWTTTPQVGHIPLDVSGTEVKFGKTLNKETVKVAQQGLGFHLIITKPFTEIDNFVRDTLIRNTSGWSSSNKNVSTLGSFINGAAGYIRNPGETLSTLENRNRLIATYSQSRYAELAMSQMKYIEDVAKGKIKTDEFGDPKTWVLAKTDAYVGKASGLNKKVWGEFVRTLDAGRKIQDPDTGLPGYFFKSPVELQDFYWRTFERAPSFAEQQAYFAYTRLYNMDLYMREISLFRNKARLGTETHQINYVPKGSNTGEKIPLPSFEGVTMKLLPGTDDFIMVHKADGTFKLYKSNAIHDTLRDSLREGIKTGKQKVVEIYDPEARTLGVLDDKGNPARIRYVVSDAITTSPLSHAQIGRRGGGHFEYDYTHYLKQPIVRTTWVGNHKQNIYEGDATFAPVDNIPMGTDLGNKFNLIRKAIDEGRMKDAKALTEATSDIPWKKVRSWFFPQRNPITNQIEPPRFNTKHDFEVVPSGTTIHEKNKNLSDKFIIPRPDGTEVDSFVDGTRHGSLARNFAVEYTGKRDSYDLFTFKNVGNKDNPVYKYEPAEFTDPIVTMTRSLSRIVNSNVLEDYKYSAMENWLQENRDIIKYKDSEINSSPFAIFNEITRASFKKGDGAGDTARINNAISNHYKIKKLIGLPSAIDTYLQGAKQALSNSLYGSKYDNFFARAGELAEKTTGSKAIATVVQAPALVPEWMLGNIKSPVNFFRSVAYHSVMGLYNLPQLLIQQANWTTIAALSPMHVMQGSFGTTMHWYSKINRSGEITNAMDFMATKFGWRPGDLTEARNILESTGFESVGNEHALRNSHRADTYLQPTVLDDVKKATLGYGQVPWLLGEKNIRIASWYTAFHEFRTENPFKKIDRVDVARILDRANIMSGDMSRSGNSMINEGFVGVSAQFYTYMYRLSETMTGKRIDNTERTRLLLANLILFGAAGVGVTGIPAGDWIRKIGIDNGYVIGKNWVESLGYEGALAFIGAIATSKDGDPEKGNWYNFGGKYGPSGVPWVKDFLRGDKTIMQIVGGAALSKALGFWQTKDGYLNAFKSMVKGEAGTEAWPLTLSDWVEGARNISSFNAAYRLGYAIEYGEWINKHEQKGANVSVANALWMTLSGTDLQSMQDQYLKSQTMKDEDANWKTARSQFAEEWHRAQVSIKDNDFTAADIHNKKAYGYLRMAHIPPERWSEAASFAAKQWQNTIDSNDDRYYNKFVPTDRVPAARQGYQDQLEKNRKNQ